MSAELPFPNLEEESTLLQDVLAFIDSEDQNLSSGPSSPDSTYNFATKKRKAKSYYSPEYDRRRREKKKAEREMLRNQISRYETQLELLRLPKSACTEESSGNVKKWGWIEAAAAEEEKRHEAEELNRQLKALLAHQVNTSQTLRSLLVAETKLVEGSGGILQRIQSVMNGNPPCPVPKPTGTYSSLGEIAVYLKGIFKHVHASGDYVFSSSPLFVNVSFSDSLMSLSTVKHHDPISGSCIELQSSTPLTCNYKAAVLLLWDMLLHRQVVGPDAGFYKTKTKHVTQNSAEVGYSFAFGSSDESAALDGATLMGKFEHENDTVLVWTSMTVQPNGQPAAKSQGWISITQSPITSDKGAVVRMCSRLSGGRFGVPGGNSDVDLPLAKKNQLLVKSRIDIVQQRMVDRAELQE